MDATMQKNPDSCLFCPWRDPFRGKMQSPCKMLTSVQNAVGQQKQGKRKGCSMRKSTCIVCGRSQLQPVTGSPHRAETNSSPKGETHHAVLMIMPSLDYGSDPVYCAPLDQECQTKSPQARYGQGKILILLLGHNPRTTMSC